MGTQTSLSLPHPLKKLIDMDEMGTMQPAWPGGITPSNGTGSVAPIRGTIFNRRAQNSWWRSSVGSGVGIKVFVVGAVKARSIGVNHVFTVAACCRRLEVGRSRVVFGKA
ncbi:MAG: hypothetical protein C0478_07200 [Planctomyces sp.]|nr:hypothetical protein [Planctomyces sp.]